MDCDSMNARRSPYALLPCIGQYSHESVRSIMGILQHGIPPTLHHSSHCVLNAARIATHPPNARRKLNAWYAIRD